MAASTAALTPEQQKLEAQARLGKIVAEGLKAIDDLVSSAPTRPRPHRREARFYMADTLCMSGALLWGPTPDQTKEAPAVLGLAEGRINSHHGAINSISSSDQPLTPPPSHPPSSSDLASSARSNRKRKSVSGSNSATPGSGHIESGTQQSPKTRARARPSRRAKTGSSRRRWTSVPPPMPWTDLGVPSPFEGKRSRSSAP